MRSFTLFLFAWIATSPLLADEVTDFTPPTINDEPLLSKPLAESHADRLHASTLFGQGRLHARRQQFVKALQLYQRAWRYDRSVVSISNELIPLAMGIKRNQEASQYAKLAINDTSANSESLMRMAVVLTRNGDYPEAIQAYQAVLNRQNDDTLSVPKALITAELGRTAFLAKDFELAAKAFDETTQALNQPEQAGLTGVHLARLKGSTGSVFLAMNEVYKATKQFTKAREAIEQSQQTAPNPAMYALRVASLYYAENKDSEALSELQRYLDLKSAEGKSDPYRLLIAINRNLVEDRLRADQKSIEQLTQALQQQPSNHYLGYTLADLANHASQPELALLHFRKFIPIQPVLSGYQGAIDALLALQTADAPLADNLTMELCWVLGLVYSRSRSLQSLEDDRIDRILSNKALLINMARLVQNYADKDLIPDDVKVNFKTFKSHTAAAMAFLFSQANDWENATTFWNLAIEQAPRQSAQFYETWGIQNLLNERSKEAIAVFERALADDNVRNKTSIHFLIAGPYLLEDKNEKAVTSAKLASDNANNNPRLLSRYPWVLYHTGQLAEAKTAYTSLISKLETMTSNPAATEISREAKLTLSNLCLASGDPLQAIEWLEQVLDRNPQDISALNDLGYLWADRNEHLLRAEQMTRTAVVAEPDNSAYRDSLGWACYRLGKFEEARSELEKARELNETDGVIYDHLGDTYFKLGDKQQARKMWQRALEYMKAPRHQQQREEVEKKLSAI